MVNTPMVIMWANSDGSITLSQRLAVQHVMPTVDDNPPRLASLQQYLTSVSGCYLLNSPQNVLINAKASPDNLRFSFSIPVGRLLRKLISADDNPRQMEIQHKILSLP